MTRVVLFRLQFPAPSIFRYIRADADLPLGTDLSLTGHCRPYSTRPSEQEMVFMARTAVKKGRAATKGVARDGDVLRLTGTRWR